MFFCPPLPYIFPAIPECFWHISIYTAAKFGQLSQVVLSMVLYL
jgi:hypothetical protein